MDTTSGFNHDKCYSGCDPEQYSKGFSRRSDTLCNANASGTVTVEPYNSKSTQ